MTYRVQRLATDAATEPTLGFEIEFTLPYGASPEIRRAALATPWMADCGSDHCGLEYRTHPGTLAWWRTQWASVTAWMDAARAAGGLSYDLHTCGGHVHVSYAHLNAEGVRRVYQLVYGNERFFRRVSQRRQSELNTWASLERGADSLLPAFARYAVNPDTVEYPGWNWGCAVRLQTQYRTLEFRLYRGTLSAAGWWNRLTMTHAVVTYAALAEADAPCTEYAFRAWLRTQPDYAEVSGWYDRLEARRGWQAPQPPPPPRVPDVPIDPLALPAVTPGRRLPAQPLRSVQDATLGFEVELEREYDDEYDDDYSSTERSLLRAAVQTWASDYGSDGSLNNGVEVRSQVRTHAAWRATRSELAAWFAQMHRETSMEARSTCGGHVHCDRRAWTAPALVRLFALLYGSAATVTYWTTVAGRNSSFGSLRTRTARWVQEQVNEYARTGHAGERYAAVNLTSHHGTIEFRLWQGVDTVEALYAHLDATQALLEFCMGEAPPTLEAWGAWVTARAADFPDLVARLQHLQLLPALTSTEELVHA